MDEAGFQLTLATGYTWCARGSRVRVPYEAPQGRRVNAIGAYCTHGPARGGLQAQVWAPLPKSRAQKPRTTPADRAAAHGLREDEVGPIDAVRVIAFIWRLAGRPAEAAATWTRPVPLTIVLDNYAVHKSQAIAAVRPAWAAAGIELLYLPAYSPELSAMEPVGHDLKAHHVPIRSFAQVAELKQAVEGALTRKAAQLRQAASKTTDRIRLSA
jgi:hypothetical protein